MPPGDSHPILRPLPGEHDLGLVDALAQVSFAVHAALTRVAAAHDLSVVQARLLGILRDRSPTINELAALLQLDKSSVTGLVDRAQERALVRRHPSQVDRRRVQVSITPAGRRLVERAHTAFGTEIQTLVAGLSDPQRVRLSALASRIAIADGRRRGLDLLATGPEAGLLQPP